MCGWVNQQHSGTHGELGLFDFSPLNRGEEKSCWKALIHAVVVVASSGSNGHFIFKHSWGLTALKGTGVGSVIFIVVWSRAQVTFSKSCTKWTVGLSSLCRPLKLCCWRNSNLISEIVPTLNGGVYVAIIVETEGSVCSKVCHAHQRRTLVCQVSFFLPSSCSRDDAGSTRNPCFSLWHLSNCKWTPEVSEMVLKRYPEQPPSFWGGMSVPSPETILLT